MAVQVVGKAVGHDATLFHDGYAGRHVLTYLVDKQRIVRAAEYHAVDVGALAEQQGDVFVDEVVGSRAVGFRDYLIRREIRVNALPASGDIVSPTLDENSLADRMTKERSYINSYVGGYRWLEYEYWDGNSRNPDKKVETTLTYTAAVSMDMNDLYTKFTDYAFPDTYLKHLFFGSGIDLEGKATLSDFASNYLENSSGGN